MNRRTLWPSLRFVRLEAAGSLARWPWSRSHHRPARRIARGLAFAFLAAYLVGFATSARAQGTDDCNNAASGAQISGTGNFSISTVSATNGNPDAGGCVNTNLDVWFYWTADCSGDVTIASCGGVTSDSVVTVWADGSPAGTCPTTSAACNDDFCSLQSSVTFAAVSGASYFIQWGAFGATTTYSGTFTISACVPPAVVPPNDHCASPITISGSGSFPFDNRLATTGTEGQSESACLFFGQTGIGKDAWWTWTPTQSGTATLTTCGTTTPAGADTKVAIYDGVGCPTVAASACNDDDSTCAAGGLNSTVMWSTVCGQTYTIQLGQYLPNTGNYSGTFSIVQSGGSCGPDNDTCSSPTVISGVGPHWFDTTNATTGTQGQSNSACSFTGGTAIPCDVWFRWTAGSTGTATLTTCGMTSANTKIAVYSGGSCTAGAPLACADDSCGSQTTLSFAAVSGSTYSIQLGGSPGWCGGSGTFTISTASPPANDSCSTPTVISGVGPHSFNTTNATTGTQGQSNSACSFAGGTAIQRDVWFRWTASSAGTATLTTCGTTSVDTKIAVYSGSGCPAAAPLACNDDACGAQTTLSIAVTAGMICIVHVGSHPGASGGTGTFRIDTTGAPANDSCATPSIISGNGPHTYDTTMATTGTQGQNNARCYLYNTSGISRDVWFRWVAPTSGWRAVDTCAGGTHDLRVAVYAGSGCPSSEPLVCDDDFCGTLGGNAKAPFFAVGGSTYVFQIGGYPGASGGAGSFVITPFTLPPGDTCSAPIAISGAGTFAWDNTGATTGFDGQSESLCSGEMITHDLWYSWTAPMTGTATVTLCAGSFDDTKIAAYRNAACPTAAALACNDDACFPGGPSVITFPVFQSQAYVLQLGMWPGALPSSGSMTVSLAPATFDNGFEAIGTSSGTYAFAIYDDGDGRRLYAAGEFDGANSTPAAHIAAWNLATSTWSPLANGIDGRVAALLVHDEDAGGPQPARLFAAGEFTSAGGIATSNIARWDGASWSALGAGTDAAITALVAFDPDGGGPQPSALHAGGLFEHAGGVVAHSVARWNGSNWQPLGSGMDGPVTSLFAFDVDGSGPGLTELYAGGYFRSAGGISANGIARWNGISWQALATGVSGSNSAPTVHAMAAFDEDGAGGAPARLFIGGTFTIAGGTAANGIARWDGTSFTAVSSGVLASASFPTIRALQVFDDGGGSKLYAAGKFRMAGSVTASFDALDPDPFLLVARWNGTTWSTLGSGIASNADDQARALAVFDDDGNGSTSLFVGGHFTEAGASPAAGVARWSGSAWQPFGSGRGLNGDVLAFASEGTVGVSLYVGGDFTTAGPTRALHIARWDETTSNWSTVGGGFDGTVRALKIGSGSIYAGGDFEASSLTPMAHVARFDGSTWLALGNGTDGPVNALEIFSGALIAGGEFSTAGGGNTANIASWNGSSWGALGGGLNGPVLALQVFNDGFGSSVFAAGDFTRAGGALANGVARWDGVNWTSLGGGLCCAPVRALAVYDAGVGPRLYAAGEFDVTSDTRTDGVAVWDALAQTWTIVGTGFSGGKPTRVSALSSWNRGGSAVLALGGEFESANGILARRIVLWNGSTWSPIGIGADDEIHALHALPTAAGETLFLGGKLTLADQRPSAHIARTH